MCYTFYYIHTNHAIPRSTLIMKSQHSIYDNIPESELIEKYNSYVSPCDESKHILEYLWKAYTPYIISQCRNYFPNSSFINYEDILMECFFAFVKTLHTFDANRGKLATALYRPLQHVFLNYVAKSHGFSQYTSLMISHFGIILRENDLTGNEDIDLLTSLYNKKYYKNPITAKSMKLYRDYYFTQDHIYLDQYPMDLLKTVAPICPDPVWQDLSNHDTFLLVQNYIKKAEGNDRLLLLFLFGFIPSVEIEGHLYSADKKPQPIGPLRKACFNLFPKLSQYLYDNDCIPDPGSKSLMYFLCSFVKLQMVADS